VKEGREYLDANGWPDQTMGAGSVIDSDPIVPGVKGEWTFLYDQIRTDNPESDNIDITYWGIVKMEDGTYRHLIQVPLYEDVKGVKVRYLVHFLVNFDQAQSDYDKLLESLGPNQLVEPKPFYTAEDVFKSLKLKPGDSGYEGTWINPFYLDPSDIENSEDLKIINKYKDQLETLKHLFPLLKKDDGSFAEYFVNHELTLFFLRGIELTKISK